MSALEIFTSVPSIVTPIMYDLSVDVLVVAVDVVVMLVLFSALYGFVVVIFEPVTDVLPWSECVPLEIVILY